MKNRITLFIVMLCCFNSYVFSQTKATGKEVMIQGFHWTTDVSAIKWYEVIKSNSATLQTAGFDAIWLPPPSKSTGGMGYIPTVWYDLNNAQGTQAQLVSLITDLHSKNIKVIADIVINHRGGTLGWYDFSTPSWNTPTETWSICNNSNISASGQKGTGNADYDPVAAGLKSAGESGSFSAARDLDHSNALVRDGIKTWMNWLKTDIGFDGWRYDFVHGYDGKYIKEYNDATDPYFSVGELLEGDRSRIVKWIDYTKGSTATASSTAFDFATKSALQNAFNDNNLSYLKDGSGKASGLIGVWPSNAVTMLDNHDTGPAPYGQDLWTFPGGQVLKGYAYLLTHPGTPMVWWPHYFNWGIKNEIDAMIKIRKDNGLSSTSALNIVAATNNLYAAIIDDKVAMKLGSDSWTPTGTGWILKLSGTGFAIWDKLSTVDVPSLTIVSAGGTYNTGATVNAVLTANINTSTIYYTTDGTEPTTASSSAVGSKSLSITTNTTLKAFVKNTANVSSAVKTETYTFSTLPTFTVYFKKPTTWASSVKVYYWGTTGTAPVVAWPGVAMTQDCGDWYSYTFPSTVSASNLIFNDGTLKTADLTSTAGIKYYDSGWLTGEPVGRCPELNISPVGGTYTTGNTVNVVLTANVNTSTIYYTTDGTDPTTASSSAVGSKSLAITDNTTLKAFVKNVANVNSAVKTEVYSFSSAPEISISPAGGTFTTGNTVNVVLTANVNTSTIYYTTDGTEPTTASASAIGTKSLAITGNTTLKAFVKNLANVSSAVKTEVYSFSSAPEISISPAGGSFTTGNTVNVVLTANVNTSTIYYTTDGTEPTTASASAIGTKSLAITDNTTLKAFVKNLANVSSAVKMEIYSFSSAPEISISPAGGTFTTGNTVNVVLTANVNTSTIYYTTDGTEPTTVSSSAVGSKSLSITDNTTLKVFVKNVTNVSSAVKTEVYSFSAAPDLSISPAGGTFTTGNTVNVVLTANVNTSTIYYTTDGTEPTTASASAIETKSLAITGNTTLKAFVKNVANVSSVVKTEVYSFSSAPEISISPAGGSFTTGNKVNVVLTANVNTSTIYYTTDGTEPTTASASAVGTKSLAITGNTTLKAFVKNVTNVSSAVKTEFYSFSSAPEISISPGGGSFTTGNTVNVVLSANVNTSTIYYTTDGTEPTTSSASAVGTKSLAITGNTTLKAFVKNVTNVSSAVKTEIYSFSSAPEVSISPVSGTFTTGNTVNVVLTANVNTSTIYYTTDGTEPTMASASAVGSKSLSITDNTTLKAFVKNVTNVSSAVKTEVYSFSSAPEVIISPVGGTFTTGNTVNVVLTANVNTSTIYYTTDGTEPTTTSSSAVGSKSLPITDNTTLKAFVKNLGNVSSAVKTEVYSFSAAPNLSISPAGGSFATGNTVNVVLTTNVNTSTIYYTTDGTEPTTASSSAVGSKSLVITDNTTLKAFVKNVANVSSAVKTEVYSFSSAPDISISLAGGSFTTGNTVNVVLTANVNTSTIYYTTDGTEPTTSSASAVGSKSLPITDNTTLKAFVKNLGNVSSAVKTEVYSFSTAPEISISPAGGSFTTGNTVNVVLTTNVNTSTIYYTTDGTEPTTASSSAVGSKSLVITDNTTLKAFVKNVMNVSSAVKTEVYSFISLNTLTVYFKPPSSWGVAPKVQYWNAIPEGSIVNSVWPGEAMVADLNGFYRYTIIGPTSVNLIFSNGLTGVNNQTVELLNKTDGYSFSWDETLGIVDNESVGNFVTVYPNPVSNFLHISSDSLLEFYQILGIQGNVLNEGNPNNNTIDVCNLREGVYLIKIKFENGKQYYKKFIKK